MIAYVFQKYHENFAFQLICNFAVISLPMKFVSFVKSSLLLTIFVFFLFVNKTLRLNNLKTRTAMNAKISVFVICAEVIIYLLLHHLDDGSFGSFVKPFHAFPCSLSERCQKKKEKSFPGICVYIKCTKICHGQMLWTDERNKLVQGV